MGGSNERPTGLNDAGLLDLDLSLVLHYQSEGYFVALIGSAVKGWSSTGGVLVYAFTNH